VYVAVKGGAAAIENSWRLLADLVHAQRRQQLPLAVGRVMTEGSLYDPQLAALAIKQAAGDLVEAIFLLRAYRTTLPRLGYSEPLDTARMQLVRRISAAFKDVPGGQLLGPTYDYTQRLLDFSLLADGDDAGSAPGDLTREPLMFPADRALRLQALSRGDEGWLLALGYSTQRGYGSGHPFAGEIRRGNVAVEVVPDELGFAIDIGDIEVTECQMINQFAGSQELPPQFTQGYGLAFGGCERKAMAVALVDRALRARELGEPIVAPAQDEEFVLSHADSLEASGFVQHLKLPHYVDFQSELELVRRLRAAHEQDRPAQQREPHDNADRKVA
jgi:alpha-D-ribose 1-methylphosphonate 5-triphosphate synthase subunit PhnI